MKLPNPDPRIDTPLQFSRDQDTHLVEDSNFSAPPLPSLTATQNHRTPRLIRQSGGSRRDRLPRSAGDLSHKNHLPRLVYYFSTSLRAAASSGKEPSGVKASWQTARPSRGRGETGTKRGALLECLTMSGPAAFLPRAGRAPQCVGPRTSSCEAIADGLVYSAKCDHKITVMIARRPSGRGWPFPPLMIGRHMATASSGPSAVGAFPGNAGTLHAAPCWFCRD